MANQAVVENLTRTRARAMQDRVETTQNEQIAKRRWRIPELTIGLVLMLGGALGSILLSRSGDSVVVVVGTAHDLERGVKIKSADLVAIETPLSLAGAYVAADEASSLLGQTVLIDIRAATPLTSSMLSTDELLQPSEALTSAAVQIGNFPSDLAVGDFVRVITVPDLASSQNTQPEMFDQVVTIWSLKRFDNDDHALITFRSSLNFSMAIASAGEVHLARVANTPSQKNP